MKLENSSNGAHKTRPPPGMARPSGIVHEVENRTVVHHSVIVESLSHNAIARKARESESKGMGRDLDPRANCMPEMAARAQARRRRRVIMVLRAIRKAVGATITMCSPWKQT